MADKVTPGLGRFNVGQPSTANNPYLKLVEQAGNQLGNVGKGYAAAQMEIGRRKSAALELVPEADFTSDSAAAGLYGADAKEIEDKVNGVGEDAYDFSNLNDVARFKKDVAGLNKELVEAEAIYNASIKNAQDLELAHSVFLETGENPEVDVNGVKVVNGKVEGQYFDVTMDAVYALRNAEGVKENGKYVLKDSNTGKVIRSYDTKQEYLEDLGYVTGADYKMAQVETPANVAVERRYGAMYDNKEKASSRIIFDVQNDLSEEARKWYAQTKGVDLKFVPTEIGDDGLTDPQRLYAEELMNEWTREQRTPAPTSGQGAGGNIDLSGYSMSQVSTTQETVTPSENYYPLDDDQIGPDGSYSQDVEYQAIVLPKPINVSASNLSNGYKIFSFAVNPVSGQLEATYRETQGKTRYAYKTSNDVLAPLNYADSEDEIPQGAIAFPEDNVAVDADENELITIPIGGNLTGLGKELYLKLSSDQTNIFLMQQEKEKHDIEAARKARVNQ